MREVRGIDYGEYPQGRKLADVQTAQIDVRADDCHGDGSYAIKPQAPKRNQRGHFLTMPNL